MLQELPAAWNMDGSAVLPTPGSEGDWMKKHWSEEDDQGALTQRTDSV